MPEMDGLETLQKELVEALVNTETSFFRDVHPWETFRKSILPALISRREQEQTLRIWCAATASGQEPYSLALLLAEHFPDVFNNWRISILATDISQEIFTRAQAGVYSQLEVNRGLLALMLVKYFKQTGTHWQREPIGRFPNPFEGSSSFESSIYASLGPYFPVSTETPINIDPRFERFPGQRSGFYTWATPC